MKRLRAILWAVVAWLPLLAMPALWAVSYIRSDVVFWLRALPVSIVAANHHGSVHIVLLATDADHDQPPQWLHANDSQFAERMFDYLLLGSPGVGRVPGAQWTKGKDRLGPLPGQQSAVMVAHWLLCVPTYLGVLLILRRHVRRWRRRRCGLCVDCGYDLRETRDRCPECGAAVGRPTQAVCAA